MIDCLEELRPSRRLVVAFTGLRHRLGGTPLDFHRSVEGLDCAALFVRDLGLRWYQYDDGSIERTVLRIRAAAAQVGAERLVCLGNSMGGFGALLFGGLVGADAILAFSPQTAIRPDLTEAMGDRRWAEHQANIPSYPCGDLAELTAPSPRTVVCCDPESAVDLAHVDRLPADWNVRRIEAPGGGHEAARMLRDRGEMMPLLRELVA